MEVKYYRCKNCCLVYNESLKVCPKCGETTFINEDNNESEPTFNLCDGD